VKRILITLIVLVILAAAAGVLTWWRSPRIGHVKDEAARAGRSPNSFAAADEDYFHDMDGAVALTADEIKGRNTWNVWVGGNDRLWDKLATMSVGVLDFVKTISSHPSLKGNRDNRWEYFGLVNEPCFDKPTGPDPNRFGLWLDKRRSDCPPDPFENEQKYPGVKIGYGAYIGPGVVVTGDVEPRNLVIFSQELAVRDNPLLGP